MFCGEIPNLALLETLQVSMMAFLPPVSQLFCIKPFWGQAVRTQGVKETPSLPS